MAKAVSDVKLKNPTVNVQNWTKESRLWRALYRNAGGHSRPFPLTIKAGYVIGVIYDICASVSQLLGHPNAQHTTYLPAFRVFASAVEMLGRCIRGNSDLWGSVADLKTGFRWLADSDQLGLTDDTVLVKTSSREYTIDTLTALGYYAADAAIDTRKKSGGTHHFGEIDPEILKQMPPLLVKGLQRYWDRLQTSKRLCNKLAKARVIAVKDWPVLQRWLLLDGDGEGVPPSMSDVFGSFSWSV